MRNSHVKYMQCDVGSPAALRVSFSGVGRPELVIG